MDLPWAPVPLVACQEPLPADGSLSAAHAGTGARSLPASRADVPSWSWRGAGRTHGAQTTAAARRPDVGVAASSAGVIPDQARRAGVVVPTPPRRPLTSSDTAADPSPDAHIRRALALVELSRLVLDAD